MFQPAPRRHHRRLPTGTMVSYAEVKSYLSKREIPQLFESLMAGLMYHRPENHIGYLQSCLDEVKSNSETKVQWSTFVNAKKRKSKEILPPLTPKKQDSFSSSWSDNSRQSTPLPPISARTRTRTSLEQRDLRNTYILYHNPPPILAKPKVPVISVLGGLGAKIDELCERVVGRLRGVVHISTCSMLKTRMTIEGFYRMTSVPACAVVDSVLQAMSMVQSASALLVAGFPRSRGDIEEYRSRRVRMDGVVLVDFEEEALRRFLEREVTSGIVRTSEIEAELERFKQDIISVAEYYDEKELLTVVMGDQDMEEIIDDLVLAVDKIIETRKNVVVEDTADIKKDEDQEGPYNALIVSPEILERPSTVEIRDATEEDIKSIEEEANKKINQESKDNELSNSKASETEIASKTPEDEQTKVESSNEITDKPETAEQIHSDPSDEMVTSKIETNDIEDVDEKELELLKSKEEGNTNEVNTEKNEEISEKSENIAAENEEADKSESEKETEKDGDELKTSAVDDAIENGKEENDETIEEKEKEEEKVIDNSEENVTEKTKEEEDIKSEGREADEIRENPDGETTSKQEICEDDGEKKEDESENASETENINNIPQDSEGNAQNSQSDMIMDELHAENTSNEGNENADKEDKASRKETDKEEDGEISEKNIGEKLKDIPNIPLVFAFENIEVDYEEIRNLIANDLEMCFIDFQELVRNDGSNEDKFDNEEALKILRKILQQDSVSYSNGFFIHKFPLTLINESIIEELMKLGNLSFVCNVKENEPNTETENFTMDKLFNFSFNKKLRIIFVTEGNVIEDLREALTNIMESKINIQPYTENAPEKESKNNILEEQNQDVELKMKENASDEVLENDEKQITGADEQKVSGGEVEDKVNENEEKEKDEKEDVITEEKVNQDDTEDSTGRDVDDLVSDDTLNEESKLPESLKGEENQEVVPNETEDTHSQASTINSADDETQKERAILARQSGIEVESDHVSVNDKSADKPKLVRQSTYLADAEAKEEESKGEEVKDEEANEEEAKEEGEKGEGEKGEGEKVEGEKGEEEGEKEEEAKVEQTKEEEAKDVEEKDEETKDEENPHDDVPADVPVDEESMNGGETKEMSLTKVDNTQGEGDDVEVVENIQNENESNQNEGTGNGESKSNLVEEESSVEEKNDETMPETKNEENQGNSGDIENKKTDNLENSQNADDITPEMKAETEINADSKPPDNIPTEASEEENQNSKEENKESDTVGRESAEIKIVEKDNEESDKQSEKGNIEDEVDNINTNEINPAEDSEINSSNKEENDKAVELNTEQPDQSIKDKSEENCEQKETHSENDATEVDPADTPNSKEDTDNKKDESKSNEEVHTAEPLHEGEEEKSREENEKKSEKGDCEVDTAISLEVRISANHKVYNDSDSNDENITIETRAEVHAIDSTSPVSANTEVSNGENADVENNENVKLKSEEITENNSTSNKNKINETEINTSHKETILDNDPEALQDVGSIGDERFSGKKQERNGSGILDESLERHQGEEEEPQERSSSSSRGEL